MITSPAPNLFDFLNHRPGCTNPVPARFMGHSGDPMLVCRECRAAAPVFVLERRLTGIEPERPEAPVSRYLLTCVRCSRDIPVHSAKPRVPLCQRCKDGATPKQEASDE